MENRGPISGLPRPFGPSQQHTHIGQSRLQTYSGDIWGVLNCNKQRPTVLTRRRRGHWLKHLEVKGWNTRRGFYGKAEDGVNLFWFGWEVKTLLTSLSYWVRHFFKRGNWNPFSELSQTGFLLFFLNFSVYLSLLFLINSVSSIMLKQPGACWTTLNDLCKVTLSRCFFVFFFRMTM